MPGKNNENLPPSCTELELAYADLEALREELKKKEKLLHQLAQDMQAQEEKNNLIIKKESYYHQLFIDNPMPMWIIDFETRQFVEVNAEAIRHYGYTREEFLSMNINDIRPVEDIEKLKSLERTATGNSSVYNGSWRHYRKNGELIWVEITSHLIEVNSKKALLVLINDVTQRENAGEELRKSFEKVQANQQLMKNAERLAQFGSWHVNFITGEVNWSDQACRIYGYEAENFSPSYEFFLDHVHPDDREYVKEKTTTPADSLELDFRIIDRDGRLKYIRSKYLTEKDNQGRAVGIHGFNLDVTESKLNDLRMEESHTRYRSIIENSPNAFFLTDNQGNILDTNNAACRMFGYSKKELLQLNRSAVQLPLPDGKTESTEIYGIKKDGTLFPMMLSTSVFATATGEERISCLGIDITYRKQYEDALSGLNKTLEKKAEELAASNKELEQFAYIASHDLQEPLRMVSSFLQLLEKKYKDLIDERGQKYIHFAVDGAERMKQLIRDLLEYSRISTTAVAKAETDMNEVMTEVLAILKDKTDELQATIEVDRLPVLPATHKTQMLQLMQNLVSNALKYHSDEKPVIKITVSREANSWVFAVKDNGIGIDPRFRDKVFTIFQRLHNKSEYSGTGIGLSVCKKIVEQHGGRIWLESQPGKGSIFYFSLRASNG
jgi:PAS domain S-box-containing protein